MAESLNVIALISGGKDSFFSILHCLQHGHKVVALGNLYPETPIPKPTSEKATQQGETAEDDEHDLNSFMYQTVGHTVIPLYEKALGIPLYRQHIIGTAVQTGTSYSHDSGPAVEDSLSEQNDIGVGYRGHDETESLVPLLTRILEEHPTANAISTGAILSTYQRTRIESVALRLGLIPLSYLWKYPILPPGTQASLLQDMEAVGLDARIVKVASGGLDEGILWENIASQAIAHRVEKLMKRFGTDGDGAVLGEGGEFETLVLDGPSHLFKGRITVHDKNRRIVREGGGSAWLQLREATVTMKAPAQVVGDGCRIPEIFQDRFGDLLAQLSKDSAIEGPSLSLNKSHFPTLSSIIKPSISFDYDANQGEIIYWSISSSKAQHKTISDEALQIVADIKKRLSNAPLQTSNIISTLIILRSMQDFATMNQIYGSLFTQPNPPARVTVACGSTMPKDTNIIIHLKIHNHPFQSAARKALHVQSRSYWAPANIGPYSQAISTAQTTSPTDGDTASPIWTVSVAGQIALIPATMALPTIDIQTQYPGRDNFKLQTVLALQHLWRIAREMDISWWTSAVAYLPRGAPSEIQKQAQIAGRAWTLAHARQASDEDEDDDDSARDLWEEKHYAGMERRGVQKAEWRLPDWEVVDGGEGGPPFWAAEVEELPRGADIEWHAHIGVVGGRVKAGLVAQDEGWKVHQCIVGYRTFVVVMILHSEDISQFEQRLGKVFKHVGGGEHVLLPYIYLSYLDCAVTTEAGKLAGIVPCRSIWDMASRRLSAVLLLDLPSQ